MTLNHPKQLIYHHSAGYDSKVAKNYDELVHEHVIVRGWSDIGYNYVIEYVDNNIPLLLNFDSRFIDDFSYAYSTAEDESMKVGVKNAISEEACEIYSPIGMEKDGDCFSSYMIPIDNLIEFYEEDLESYSGLTLDQLLKTVVIPNRVPFNIREPRELAYEVRDDETFEYHFNSDMDSALDTLLEKLENSEDYSDLDEYKRIYTFISNKYGFDKSIPVETTEGDVTIKLINIDPTDNKISFELLRSGENYNFKKGRAKLSTIQQLMSNYQLFDPFED